MTSTMTGSELSGEELQRKRSEYRDQLRQLGMRINNQKNPGPPPWCWVNLNATEAALLDQALDEFVEHYNRIRATVVDEVIPQCWRKHPALAQELPVQFWTWWAANIDVRATIAAVNEYHSRGLPGFQSRLPKLIGKGATNCRKGQHMAPTDPELIEAITVAGGVLVQDTARTPETRRVLRREDFGTMEGLA